jgi:hypothetical protein
MNIAHIAHIVLSAVLAVMLLMTGGGKITNAASSLRIRDSLAVPARLWKAIGALELLIVAGLVLGTWVHLVVLVAAIGVVVLMIGAIATRIRAGGEQRNSGVVADAVVLVVGVGAVVIAGAR